MFSSRILYLRQRFSCRSCIPIRDLALEPKDVDGHRMLILIFYNSSASKKTSNKSSTDWFLVNVMLLKYLVNIALRYVVVLFHFVKYYCEEKIIYRAMFTY